MSIRIKPKEYKQLINLLSIELRLIESTESNYPIIDSLQELRDYSKSIHRKMLLAHLIEEAIDLEILIDQGVQNTIELNEHLLEEYRRYFFN